MKGINHSDAAQMFTGKLGKIIYVQYNAKKKLNLPVPTQNPIGSCRLGFMLYTWSTFLQLGVVNHPSYGSTHTALLYKMYLSVCCLELNAFKAVSQTACREKCKLLLDGYGAWVGEQWRPYKAGRNKRNMVPTQILNSVF